MADYTPDLKALTAKNKKFPKNRLKFLNVPPGRDWTRLEHPITDPWDHQLTALQALHRCENETFYDTFKPSIDSEEEVKVSIKLRLGVFGEKVGSGKTLTMMMLIAFDNFKFSKDQTPLPNCNPMNGYASVASISKFVDTTFVVLDHHLVDQWANCAKTDIGMRPDTDDFLIVRGDKVDSVTTTKMFSGKFRVVFMTDLAYKDLCEQHVDTSYVIKRLVIDEADTIKIPNLRLINAGFTWLMTGTPRCFHTSSRSVNDKAKSVALNNIFKVPKNVAESSGKVHAHHMQNISNKLAIEKATVFCTRQYINHSLKLPDEDFRSIGHPIIAEMLEIKQNDNKDLKDVSSGELIEVPRLGLAYAGQLNIRAKIYELLGNRYCALSLKELDEPDSVPMQLSCCKFWVDRNVLGSWQAAIKETACFCPVCNTVDPTDPLLTGEPHVPCNVMELLKSYSSGKHVNKLISSILTKNHNASILVFEDKGNVANIESYLKAKCIPFAKPKGQGTFITKIIDQYKSGHIKVLILSSDKTSSGLNLENTTHIIFCHSLPSDRFEQCKGRGQRYPRSTPLVVYHMQADLMREEQEAEVEPDAEEIVISDSPDDDDNDADADDGGDNAQKTQKKPKPSPTKKVVKKPSNPSKHSKSSKPSKSSKSSKKTKKIESESEESDDVESESSSSEEDDEDSDDDWEVGRRKARSKKPVKARANSISNKRKNQRPAKSRAPTKKRRFSRAPTPILSSSSSSDDEKSDKSVSESSESASSSSSSSESESGSGSDSE